MKKITYISSILVFLHLFVVNCASNELIPDKYNKKDGYYIAEAVGKTRSEAFGKAQHRLLARVAAMIISDISSRTSLVTTEKRDKFLQRIKNSTDVTLLNIKPVYKNYKKVDKEIRCGLVIYFPDSRVDRESQKIINRQKKLEEEIEMIFKESNESFQEGKINKSITLLSSIENRIDALIFSRESYFSKTVNSLVRIIGALDISKNITPHKFLKVNVKALVDEYKKPVSYEKFIIKTWRETGVVEKIQKTNSKGSFNFNLKEFKDCADTLYICPAAIDGISNELYEAFIKHIPDRNIFTMVWNIWGRAVVNVDSVKVEEIEWYVKKGLFFSKKLPSNIKLHFTISEKSGRDVYINFINVDIIKDREGSRDPVVKKNVKFDKKRKLLRRSQLSFDCWLSKDIVDVIRKFYDEGFVNIILKIRLMGKDLEGRTFRTNPYRLIISHNDFYKHREF